MRKLRCYQIPGTSVQEVLDEFNERLQEFGVSEDDILSVNAMPATQAARIHDPNVGEKNATLEVVIVYWSQD
jgi:hypothetical protein